MFKKDGNPFDINVTQVIADVQYPAGYFSDAEAREAFGIVDVPEQLRPDDRYYWVNPDGQGGFTSEPKDLATLKETMVAEVKNTAATILRLSDWKIVRAVENAAPCDQATLDYRLAVRAASNAAEAAINGCSDVPALASLKLTWPEAQ